MNRYDIDSEGRLHLNPFGRYVNLDELPNGLPDEMVSDIVEFCRDAYWSFDAVNTEQQCHEYVKEKMRSLAEIELSKKDEEIKKLKMEAVGLFKLERVNELLKKASKSAWDAALDNENKDGWKEWDEKSNKLNVN